MAKLGYLTIDSLSADEFIDNVKYDGQTDAALTVTTTAETRNVVMKFRPIIAIPPFLVKTILNAASSPGVS